MKKLIILSLVFFVINLNTSNAQSGNALDFDETTFDYIEGPDTGFPTGNSARTIEAWVNFSACTTFGPAMEYGTFSDGQKSGFGVHSSGAAIWWGQNDDLVGTTLIDDGSWHHIAATYDGTNLIIYIDGVIDASTTKTLNTVLDGTFRIGSAEGTAWYFTGQYDEVRVWDIARSQANIQADMNSYITSGHAQWTNLLAYFRFDQGISSGNNTTLVNEVIDYSGNCHKGTLTNFALNGATSNWVSSGNTEAPIPSSYAASSVTGTNAQLNGEIFAIGETSVTTRGFCYSINDCPTITDNLVNESGSYSAGTYNLTASNLTPGTTYYYRAYATNIQGTSYGEIQSFTTPFISLGNALSFDGTDDFVNLGSILSSSYTKEAWIYITDLTEINSILAGGTTDGLHLLWAPSGYGNRLSAGHDGTWNQVQDTDPLTANTWYHVCVTYDEPSETMTLYKNGEIVSTNSSVPAYTTGNNVRIGAFNDASNVFEGNIDEVRIWNDVRTQTEIQNNMNSYLTGNEANLTAYYRFDQGNVGNDNSGLVNELIDYTGNCNKGTLSNFALSGASSNWVYPGNIEAPILTTDAVIESYPVTLLSGNIYSIGETDVSIRGFCWSTSDCPTISDNLVNESGTFGTGTYSLNAAGFSVGTTYYYRAYATNAQGTSYGEVQTFTTTSFTPFGNALDFDGTDDNVSIGNLGNTNSIEFWINPSSITEEIINLVDGTHAITVTDGTINVTGLISPTIYVDGLVSSTLTAGNWQHVAITTNTQFSSLNVNFGLVSGYLNGQLDEVRIWSVERTEAEILNNIYNYLNGDETGLIAYYRMDQGNVGADNTTLVSELIDYTGSCNKGTLTNFALNGTSSNWVHPGNPETPILGTLAPINVHTVTTLNGEIYSIGESTVTTRGFCWSTSDCPTISDNLLNETGLFNVDTFTMYLAGLSVGTTYYYRAYATNGQGTSYGEVQSFTPTAFISLGNALDFDGTNDNVDLGDQADFDFGTSSFTFEAWIKTDDNSINQRILNKRDGSTSVFDFAYRGASNNDLYLFLRDGTNEEIFSSNINAISDNDWHNVVVSVNRSGGNITTTFYVDGVEHGSTVVADVLGSLDNALPVKIGSNNAGAGYFNGQIDEIKVWNDVRTLTEIHSNMYNYLSGSEANLVAYYRFDQGEINADNSVVGNNITELIDYAGCNTGTLSNFTLTGATSNWVHPGNPEAPVLMTNSEIYAYYTTAGLSGEIFTIGETDVTTRGFQYATDACFTTNVRTAQESGTYASGAYSLTGYGFIPNTTYYVRAYSTNDLGTSYAETRTITTTNNNAPGTALDLDGSNDFVQIPNDISLNVNTTLTLEAWVYLDNVVGAKAFIARYYTWGDVTNTYYLGADNSTLQFFVNQSDNSHIIISSNVLTTGRWYHVSAVADGTNLNLYLDGISVATPVPYNGTIMTSGRDVFIGKYRTEDLWGISDIKTDEVRIWNDARTQEEIINYMNRTIENPPAETNLIAYYRMDNGSGTTVSDETGTNTGTLTNNDGDEWIDSEAFNVWMGTSNTNWTTAANWSDGLPGATDNIHIYPSYSPSTTGDVTINNIVVQNGGSFTVSATNLFVPNSNLFTLGQTNIAASGGGLPGMITIPGYLYVGSSGTLNLLSPSNSNPSGSLILEGNIIGTGTVNVNRYFNVNRRWQYVGVPMANQSSALFTENTAFGYYNPNLLYYNEADELASDPTDSEYSNWDNYNNLYIPAQPLGEGNGVDLTTGMGYLTYNDGDIMVNFSSIPADLNSGNFNIDVHYTDNEGATFGNFYDGWNLIANPFTSAIDWSSITLPANVDATMYIWDGLAENYVYNSGIPLWGTNQTNFDPTEGSTYIPAMQAFYVHLTNPGTGDFSRTISLENTSKVHNVKAMNKSTKSPDFEYVKLKTENGIYFDETMVGLFDDATKEFDPQYDAYKRFPNENVNMLYSMTTGTAFPLALNALPSNFANTVVPIAYKTDIAGEYSITFEDYKLFDGTKAFFLDAKEDIMLDIRKNTSYSFNIQSGNIAERFKIIFQKSLVSVNEINVSEFDLNIYSNKMNVYININDEDFEEANVQIIDILGKKVVEKKIYSQKNVLNVSNVKSGYYIVKVISNNKYSVNKIFLN